MKRVIPFVLVAALCVAAGLRDAADDWVDATELPLLVLPTSPEVRDRQGELLRAYTVGDGLWRLEVGLDGVDPAYVAMLLAYEDKRFWQHSGVDARAMVRAAWQALWNRRIISGGSTLTMQVARMLEDGASNSLGGKLRQIRLALALERRLDKREILGLYLLQAPFGGNVEGVRAAALAYFGKEPARLTPAEAALLVAIPQSPTARRPDEHPQNAKAGRDQVLHRMQRNGLLQTDAVTAALNTPVPREKRAFPALAPHLADRILADDPANQHRSLTIDATLQRKLETLATRAARAAGENLSIAIVLADHQSGEILASVGSAGFGGADARQGYVDMTRALRSPGSTLKPLVYAMAFDQGLAHPETLIDDHPIAFGGYAPQNFDGEFRGEVRVSDALQMSLNIPVVMLTQEIGPPRLMAALRRSGAMPKLPAGKPGLAIALGGLGVSLHDMVQLYAGLAEGGKRVDLHWERQENPSESEHFVSRSAAWQVAHILSGLAPPRGAPLNRLAYKTGTSYGHRDAWALGFDGRHVAGVWMGRADGTPVPGAFGGDLAAPVLFEVFQRLKPALELLPPPPPETLLLSAANLPLPLQRFRPRTAVFSEDRDAPQIAFPPQGARVASDGAGVTAKVRNGVPPFTWLANGQPVTTASFLREITLPDMGQGFANVSVIDALGRAARVHFEVQ